MFQVICMLMNIILESTQQVDLELFVNCLHDSLRSYSQYVYPVGCHTKPPLITFRKVF